jgi:hypothetical protein
VLDQLKKWTERQEELKQEPFDMEMLEAGKAPSHPRFSSVNVQPIGESYFTRAVSR